MQRKVDVIISIKENEIYEEISDLLNKLGVEKTEIKSIQEGNWHRLRIIGV